jgi:hypothetical protein
MKYVYNVILQKTTCLKSDVEFSSLAVPNLLGTLCQVQDNSTEIPAKFSIWTQAWKNFVKVVIHFLSIFIYLIFFLFVNFIF